MLRQSKLVFLLFLSVAAWQLASGTASAPGAIHFVHDDITDNQLESAEELTVKPHKSSGVKISTARENVVPTTAAPPTKAASVAKTLPTKKPVSDEIIDDLLEAAKHNAALADDPRFNKIVAAEKSKLESAKAKNKTADADDYDYYNYSNYDDDYNYDEKTTNQDGAKDAKDAKASPTSTTAKPTLEPAAARKAEEKELKIVDIADDQKYYKNDVHEENDGDDDADDDADDDDDDDNEENYNEVDDIADEEEVVFSENVPCPRYCVCARNINNYMVATCSRLDQGTQKFGSDITDLIVTDVGPRYPILLGPKYFVQLGLKHVSTIKLANCTIQYLHPEAFHGLDELYSVNLTNVGLAIMNPDTFATNKKLRMLTIADNDLNVMSSVHYLLNSSSLEELVLSRNNLGELNPNAFSQLANIVYINLSQNNLQELPEKLFERVVTLEELDLSYNALKTLPSAIFNRTSLAILHLKYNSITGDLRFGSSDLQQLDLSFNSINHIHHGMFDKMSGLTNLNLKGNGITKIQPDSFLTLKTLRHIDLSINELDQISSMVFYKNSELDVIRLNDNPRLSQLPTDGFINYNGYFTAYFLDVSNCAIGALGHKTFSTMPHLVTLKLAWNNINNLERDTFNGLSKLIDLDLGNNLIAKLDELTFMNNNDLTKLNLAGNPIHKLSVRLFLPMNKLRELDVSDCELTSLLADHQYGVGHKYKFFDTLRTFNASANQIKRISSADVKNFKNLRTLDISRNPLKCNEDFQDFISYISLNTNMVPNKVLTLENINSDTTFVQFQAHADWATLAHEVCKHLDNNNNNNSNKAEHKSKAAKDDNEKDNDEEYADALLDIEESSKVQKLEKILKDSRKSEVAVDQPEEPSDENDDEYDDYENEETESDENEDDYDAVVTPKHSAENKLDFSKLKEHSVKVQTVPLTQEEKDRIIAKKFLLDGRDDLDSGEEQEIIIERGHVYYSGSRFMIPLIVLILCSIVLVLVIAKVVSMVMRKRGERYRMALLASSKNSIVYQKLSEDIKPAAKEPKQPKVHRYAPLNHV